MIESVLDPERSARSARIRGLYGVVPLEGILVGVPSVGNVNLYSAVWFVTVISAVTDVLSCIAK